MLFGCMKIYNRKIYGIRYKATTWSFFFRIAGLCMSKPLANDGFILQRVNNGGFILFLVGLK